MHPEDFRRLYAFATDARSRFLAAFRELGWEEANRDRGATWGSLQEVFVHILEMEDSWLHYDLFEEPWPHGERLPSAFDSFEAMEAYDRELARKTEALLDRLTKEELARAVRLEDGRRMTVEDILIHALVDEVAHLGELVCLFWQLDVRPPWVNWGEVHAEPAE